MVEAKHITREAAAPISLSLSLRVFGVYVCAFDKHSVEIRLEKADIVPQSY